MPTIAVLMHFVITPTDPSIAHVNLDLQEMEKTAQVVDPGEVDWEASDFPFLAILLVC